MNVFYYYNYDINNGFSFEDIKSWLDYEKIIKDLYNIETLPIKQQRTHEERKAERIKRINEKFADLNNDLNDLLNEFPDIDKSLIDFLRVQVPEDTKEEKEHKRKNNKNVKK